MKNHNSDGRQLIHKLHGKKIQSVKNVRSKTGVEQITITTTDGIKVRIGSELLGTDLRIESGGINNENKTD